MHFRARTNDQRKLEVNWDLINAYAQKWKPGTFLDVTITRRKKVVSDPFRKYYWGCVMPLALEAFGYDPDEADAVHRQFKIVFFGVTPDDHGIYRDKDIPSVFSNESDVPMDRKQSFVEWIKRKAAEQGCYIPDPNE